MKPYTITIKPLSDTEYDLFVRVGKPGRDRQILDAHLRRELPRKKRVWVLDVFDSNKTSLTAHIRTTDGVGHSTIPSWQEVFNVLTDLLRIMEQPLFAAVPVPGPPCLKCKCKTTRYIAGYYVCANGHKELADTSGD